MLLERVKERKRERVLIIFYNLLGESDKEILQTMFRKQRMSIFTQKVNVLAKWVLG